MNRSILFCAVSLGCAVAWAAPVVSDVALTQDPASRRVEIAYTLANEPAYVMLDIQTNGVSIGRQHFADAFGDLNAVVQPAETAHRSWWQPDVSWAFNRVTNESLKAVVKVWATNAPPDYLVYDLTGTDVDRLAYYERAEDIPGGVTNAIYKETKLVMRRIHAANVRWRMGSPVGEMKRASSETAHYVTLTKDYYMAIYPWTQRQHKEVTGSYMSTYTRATRSLPNCDWRPCENKCAFNDVRGGETVTDGSYIGQIRARTGDVTFDLPTEAQWEFACRAGSLGATYLGVESTTNNFDRIGWRNATGDTGDSCTQPVGFKEPNAWGLYDMLGTIQELCLDWSAALGSAEEVDPTGPASGTARVIKGCGMNLVPDSSGNTAHYVDGRSAWRSSQAPATGSLSIGFRVICEAAIK